MRLATPKKRRHNSVTKAPDAPGGDMGNRTPLEQHIFETKDKRGRYERSMREKGLVKTSVWIREDRKAELRKLVSELNNRSEDPPE